MNKLDLVNDQVAKFSAVLFVHLIFAVDYYSEIQ
jgi:hypothetical protein